MEELELVKVLLLMPCMKHSQDNQLNCVVGENLDEAKVLKVAPMGKAAFNIKGNTLHSAFKIPANREFQFRTLDTVRVN